MKRTDWESMRGNMRENMQGRGEIKKNYSTKLGYSTKLKYGFSGERCSIYVNTAN